MKKTEKTSSLFAAAPLPGRDAASAIARTVETPITHEKGGPN